MENCVIVIVAAATSSWSTLEAAKLAVAALTPVLVALGGFWLNRRLRSLEAAQWSRQKIIERRILAYDQLASGLNDVYCFFTYIGSWKELDPPSLITLKRSLDKRAHISAPLFDTSFLSRYNDLMDLCFSTFGDWGRDATLRTLTDRRRQALDARWNPQWDACFADRSSAAAPSDVKRAYAELMAYLATTMGATEVDARILGGGRLPVDHDRRLQQVVSRTATDD